MIRASLLILLCTSFTTSCASCSVISSPPVTFTSAPSEAAISISNNGEVKAAITASDAVTAALTSPLLELDIEDSKGALVNVTGGDDMTLQEAHEVVREVHSKINKDARIIWGASIDSTLEHQIRVMLVVTGVKSSQILGPPSGVDDGLQNRYGIEFVQ